MLFAQLVMMATVTCLRCAMTQSMLSTLIYGSAPAENGKCMGFPAHMQLRYSTALNSVHLTTASSISQPNATV
uniref:Secreted protein n=1 Tax=Arundo donax TaxID=35708 RepID=A0A0A9CZF8_ARUDO